MSIYNTRTSLLHCCSDITPDKAQTELIREEYSTHCSRLADAVKVPAVLSENFDRTRGGLSGNENIIGVPARTIS